MQFTDFDMKRAAVYEEARVVSLWQLGTRLPYLSYATPPIQSGRPRRWGRTLDRLDMRYVFLAPHESDAG